MYGAGPVNRGSVVPMKLASVACLLLVLLARPIQAESSEGANSEDLVGAPSLQESYEKVELVVVDVVQEALVTVDNACLLLALDDCLGCFSEGTAFVYPGRPGESSGLYVPYMPYYPDIENRGYFHAIWIEVEPNGCK
jgi:hypothetical protein